MYHKQAKRYVGALSEQNPLDTPLSGGPVLADLHEFLFSDEGQVLIAESKKNRCCVPITRSIHAPVTFLGDELFNKRAVIGLNKDGELRVLVGWSVGDREDLAYQVPDARYVRWREAIWPSNFMLLPVAHALSKKFEPEELSPQRSIAVWRARLGITEDNNQRHSEF